MNTEGIQSYRGKKVHDGYFETKFEKLGLGLNLKECTSSFAPASQQRIKRLKPTNTRLKQQFEEFWEPKKTQRGAGPRWGRVQCNGNKINSIAHMMSCDLDSNHRGPSDAQCTMSYMKPHNVI